MSVTGAIQEDIVWTCVNSDNAMIASGIYLVRINGAGIDKTKKVAVLK